MTQRAMKKMAVLRATEKQYSPRVQAKLSEAGKSTGSAMGVSAAKYYPALKKLASK